MDPADTGALCLRFLHGKKGLMANISGTRAIVVVISRFLLLKPVSPVCTLASISSIPGLHILVQ